MVASEARNENYLGLEKDLYKQLAETQAVAFRDMQPKVHIWNTGSNASKQDIFAPLLNGVQSLGPMLDTLQSAGMKIPFWSTDNGAPHEVESK